MSAPHFFCLNNRSFADKGCQGQLEDAFCYPLYLTLSDFNRPYMTLSSCFSFEWAVDSNPQAALISSPRDVRMVVIMPRDVSVSRNRIIASLSGEKYGESGIL